MFKGNALLIHTPAVKLKLDGVNLGAVRTHFPKISQLILGAIIEREFPDASVEIADMRTTDTDRETFYKEIKYGDKTIEASRVGQDFASLQDKISWADVIIFTSNFTQEAGVTGDLIEFCKLVNPEARVLVGGSDAMVLRGEVDRQSHFYSRGADLIVSGDGEITLPRVLMCEETKGNPVLSDFDLSPNPALHLINISDYIEDHEGPLPPGVEPPLMYVETSRGCRQSCDFCATPFTKGKYRYMSQGRIEDLLGYFREAGVRTLPIIEDNVLSRLDLPGGRDAILKWFTYMREQGFVWSFANGIEIGQCYRNGRIDDELIETLFHYDGNAGCYRAYVPLERVDSQEAPYRKLKPFDIERAILMSIISKGVPTLNIGVIIGNPQENQISLDRTEMKLIALKEEILSFSSGKTFPYVNLFLHIPIVGTNDYRRFYKEGNISYNVTEYPELYNFYTCVLNGENFTGEELTQIRRDMAFRINGEDSMKEWEHTGRYYRPLSEETL